MATRKIEVEDANVQQDGSKPQSDEKFFDSSDTVHENLPHDDTRMTGGPYDPTAREADPAPEMKPVVEGDDAE